MKALLGKSILWRQQQVGTLERTLAKACHVEMLNSQGYLISSLEYSKDAMMDPRLMRKSEKLPSC